LFPEWTTKVASPKKKRKSLLLPIVMAAAAKKWRPSFPVGKTTMESLEKRLWALLLLVVAAAP